MFCTYQDFHLLRTLFETPISNLPHRHRLDVELESRLLFHVNLQAFLAWCDDLGI